MSGHEKFYIPHDDLLALIAAMATLETDVETLNTNLIAFNKAMLELGTETSVTDAVTIEAGTDDGDIEFGIIDASDNVYIKRIRIILLTSSDIFEDYSADILMYLKVGSSYIWNEFYCDSQHGVIQTETGGGTWAGNRIFSINEALIEAGQSLTAEFYGYKMSDDVTISIHVYYAKEIGT